MFLLSVFSPFAFFLLTLIALTEFSPFPAPNHLPITSLSTHGNTHHLLPRVVSPRGCLLNPQGSALLSLLPTISTDFLLPAPFLVFTSYQLSTLNSLSLSGILFFSLALSSPPFCGLSSNFPWQAHAEKVGDENRTGPPVKFMACVLILFTSDTSVESVDIKL